MTSAEKHFKRAQAAIAVPTAGSAAAAVSVSNTPTKGATLSGVQETVVLMVSDFQIGKRTPTFNADVARLRVREYASKACAEVNGRLRQGKQVDRAHIWLLGDIVEGEDIFPGQAHEIHESLMEQITDAVAMLGEFVRTIRGVVSHIHITGVVGNHGRLGRKGQYSQASNADKMVYRMMQMSLQDVDGLTFKLPRASDTGWYTVDVVGNYSCLLVHGDEFGGSAAGGKFFFCRPCASVLRYSLTISSLYFVLFAGFPSNRMATKCTKWQTCSIAGEMPPFTDIAHGHYHHVTTHTLANGAVVRGAGSIESHNDFALRVCAASAKPSQRMMFVDPVAGEVTCEVATLKLGCASEDAVRLLQRSARTHGVKVVTKAMRTCERVLANILSNPRAEKYRKVKTTNIRFARDVMPVPGATDILVAAGFQLRDGTYELCEPLRDFGTRIIVNVVDQLRALMNVFEQEQS